MNLEIKETKFFLVKEYYEYVKQDLTNEELLQLISAITAELKKRNIETS